MRLSLLAFLPLFMAPQVASAEAWRLAAYSTDAPQMVYMIDVDSIQRQGTRVTFKQQSIYETTSPTRDFDRTVMTRQADCFSRESSFGDSSFFINGKLLGSEKGPSTTTTAKDGSVLFYMIEAVCGRRDFFSPVLGSPESWARDKFRTGF